MKEAVIISAARTAVGKFGGSLKNFPAPQLGSVAIAEAVKRATLEPKDVQECMEQVSLELRSGGRSFDELLEALDVDGPVLERVLGEMMEQGLVHAHREEGTLSYHLGGPMLRSLAR